jgi:CDP-paratose 2-epimerase
VDPEIHAHGIGETRAPRFRGLSGCSKGAADQYVLEYALSHGLKATSLRLSGVYGFHQWGNEDHAWLARFTRQILRGEELVIRGDGKQVRDLLEVSDLLDAFLLAWRHAEALSGQGFNIGGGPANAVSLIEAARMVGQLHGTQPLIRHEEREPRQPRYYVSDCRSFAAVTGWQPRIELADGARRLYEWMRDTGRANEVARPALYPAPLPRVGSASAAPQPQQERGIA